MKHARYKPWISLVLALVACMWSLNTMLSASKKLDTIIRKQSDLTKIRLLATGWTAEQQWSAQLDRIQAWRADNLEILAEQALGIGQAHIAYQKKGNLPYDWQHMEATVETKNALFMDVYNFLRMASSSLPPWRLQSITLTAMPDEHQVHAKIVLETLEKECH